MMRTMAIKIAGVFCALFALLFLSAGVSRARADFGIVEAGASLTSEGAPSRQAGAHPDLDVHVWFPAKVVNGVRMNDGAPQNVAVNLPPGLLGNPVDIPTCSQSALTGASFAVCPVASQVGIARVGFFGAEPNEDFEPEVAVYNIERPRNAPALFAFNFLGSIIRFEARVRPGDFGISVLSAQIPQALPLKGADVTFWGVPADPSHDGQRVDPETFSTPTRSTAPLAPLIRNPTSCTKAPQAWSLEAQSWEEPEVNSRVELLQDPEGKPFEFEGCDRLAFSPSTTVEPTARTAGAPLGLTVSIKVPQNEGPNGLATADVKDTVVTLPQGFAISASAAGGQGACSEAQIGIGSNAAPTCPDSSRLGSVRIKTPLLDEELEGSVYLAQQKANPFGSNYAMYLAAKGPGFYIKLPGKVETDPATGQVTAGFRNQPQLPYESIDLRLRSGPTAPLVAPSACGTYQAQVEMTSWASATPVQLTSPMKITEGCSGGGFSPGFKAGTADPTGGSYSPFMLEVTQGEGEANLSRIQATLPPGLLAKLAGVPLCGDAQAATGDCPASSQVGTTTVGAGPGANPVYLPEAGKAPTAVYLAGPYKGAPYSLVVKVPAQAGPFDLGTVVVRNALRVDPTTTQVTAESDPLPQILEGIPVSYRDVRVDITRPEFTLDPTNCSQFAVTSVLTSASGQSASPTAPFAAANCERLGFKPTLALQMSGQTRRAGNPALTATLKAPKGQANIANTTVVLPKTVFIDQSHVGGPCTRVQFNADACPASSVLGTATAWSPLLDKPLEGPVYFRSNGGERQLPDIVADLGGQIHVVLVGFIDSKKAGGETSLVRTRFASVPDAPVSKFVLKLKGGKRSLIQNSADLCKAKPSAEVKMRGQNGKTDDFMQKIAVDCGGPKRH